MSTIKCKFKKMYGNSCTRDVNVYKNGLDSDPEKEEQAFTHYQQLMDEVIKQFSLELFIQVGQVFTSEDNNKKEFCINIEISKEHLTI